MTNRIISIFFLCFYIFSNDCFSQFDTKTKYVGGYSKDFSGANIGIAIRKAGPKYFMRFRIYIPATEYGEIFLSRNSKMTFDYKDGSKVELDMGEVQSEIVSNRETNDFKLMRTEDGFITKLSLPVTKEQLLEISKKPFDSIRLPYFKNPSKNGELIFLRPLLFFRNKFIEDDINYILGI